MASSSKWADVASEGNVMDHQISMTTGPSSSWIVDKSSVNPKKIIRFASLKRGKEEVPLTEKVKLDRVIGLTVTSNVSLACDPITGAIIYPAGCVVVIYNPRKNKQTHIINASKKTITTLAVSIDGKYIVTGECGHQPHVRVWDIQEKSQVAEFPGHKFGINCVAFSPNQKYVVSVGSQHDMIVNVWEWRSNIKVASNKVSSKVKAVAFSEDGGHFVTVGNRHVKFWYLDYFRSTKYKEPVPLMGRSAILGDQRNNYFCDVACGRGDLADSTFSITKSGLLCEFNNRRLLDKWVELRTSSANCLSVGIDYIFIGCADGIVRCFNPYTLQFLTTLPRTHHLGVDVAKGLTIAHMGSQPSSAKYPDTVAVVLDESNNKVTCIYNDHSLYMWDIHDVHKVGKSYSFLSHSACIWGVEVFPLDIESPLLPKGSFITCSSDDTIRIWNLEPNLNDTSFKKNVYSSELLKILYIDENLTYLCDKDHNVGSNEKVDTTYDSRNGVRCIKVSPDGKHLASGDRSGNIRIHDLQYMEEQCKIEAHDAEVLCLEYSKLESNNRYLASASRDRLIHVFDVDNDYVFLQTLDDHSSSITSVRFVQQSGQLQMISCGADKSVIFRTAQFNPSLHFSRAHHVVGKTTLYDMEVDCNQKYILTACQDRNIRIYNIQSGKHTRTFKGSQGEDGTLIKIVLDNSGLFVATSSTDKNLCVYDFISGDCVATMFGHSEIVTGFRFSNDGKHLISVSGDGCIFVWKLPSEITHSIQVRTSQLKNVSRIKQEAFRKSMYAIPPHLKPPSSPDFESNHLGSQAVPKMFEINPGELDENGAYRFSVGPLPLWAKKQITDDALAADGVNRSQNVAQPRGRWAQRIDSQGIVVKSIYDSDHVIPFPGQAETDGYYNGSDNRRETLSHTKQDTDAQDDFEPCSDSLSQIKSSNVGMPEGFLDPVNTVRGGCIDYTRARHHSESDIHDQSVIDDLDLNHDGDIADDETDSTDTDFQEIIYYPPLEHISKYNASEFKVCNTNPDDLREAHRRNKKMKAEKLSDIPSLYVQGASQFNFNILRSTDSEDEEDVSASYTTDKNHLSNMYSVSTESLDRVGQREMFLKNNFESLSGDKDDDLESNDNRLSISAQFLSKSSSKDPVNLLKKEQECTSPKKLELMKQIEETRKKLDTIGWKASLNNSKSISDLTHIPEKDVNFKHPSTFKGTDCISEPQTMASSMPDLCATDDDAPNDEETASPFSDSNTNLPLSTLQTTLDLATKKPLAQSLINIKGKSSTNITHGTLSSASKRGVKSALAPSSCLKQSPQLTRQALAKKVTIKQVLPSRCDSDKSETIRRASSMSDLSKPKRLLPSPPSNVASKTYRPPDSYSSLRRIPKRSSEQPRVADSRLSRSSSLSTLAVTEQDDSRLTRPTISSLNKARGGQDVSHRTLPKSASSSHLPRSRRDGHIAGSGTSSGETSPTENKPNLPVRLRSTSMDRSNSAKYARPESRISVTARSTANARSSLASSRATSERDLSKLARGVTEKLSSMPNNIATANITVTKTSKHELFLKPHTTATTTTRRAVSVSLADGLLEEHSKMLEKSPQELPVKDRKLQAEDVLNAPLTRILCEMTAEELKLAADNVLQLCKRISMENDLTEPERLEMIDILSQAVNQAHVTLRPIPSVTVPPEISQLPANKKGTDQPGNVDNMSSLLQQYSDMLFTLVQQRMNTQPGTV